MYREKLTHLGEEGAFEPRLLLEIGHKAEKGNIREPQNRQCRFSLLASSPLSRSVSLHVGLPPSPYRDLHTNTRIKSETLPVTVKGTQGGTRT